MQAEHVVNGRVTCSKAGLFYTNAADALDEVTETVIDAGCE